MVHIVIMEKHLWSSIYMKGDFLWNIRSMTRNTTLGIENEKAPDFTFNRSTSMRLRLWRRLIHFHRCWLSVLARACKEDSGSLKGGGEVSSQDLNTPTNGSGLSFWRLPVLFTFRSYKHVNCNRKNDETFAKPGDAECKMLLCLYLLTFWRWEGSSLPGSRFV